MKICVCSAATKNMEWQYKYTNELKKRYCDIHGYEFRFEVLNCGKRESFHNKRKMVLANMKDFDWVVWMDVDSWFNDFSKKIEDLMPKDPTICMVVARNHPNYNVSNYPNTYVNAGVFMIKSCDDSREMLNVWGNPSDPLKQWIETINYVYDQAYLCIRVLADEWFRKRTAVVDHVVMNWCPYKEGDASDKYILHCMGCGNDNNKRARMYECICGTFLKNKINSSLVNELKAKRNEMLSGIVKKQKQSLPVAPKKELRRVIPQAKPFVPPGFEIESTLDRARKSRCFTDAFGTVVYR